AARLARSLMPAQSPLRIASALATQVPPTTGTFGRARYSAAFSSLTPPVGQNTMPANTGAHDFNMATPPYSLAGKNFRNEKPNSRAVMTSVGVTAPGRYGRPEAMPAAARLWVRPGLTRNLAPAFLAAVTSAGRSTVPAPTSASGRSRAIFS